MLELPGQSERTIYGNAQSLVKLFEQFALPSSTQNYCRAETSAEMRDSCERPRAILWTCALQKLRFYSMADVEKKRVWGEQPVAWPKAKEVSRALLARLRGDARRDSRQSPLIAQSTALTLFVIAGNTLLRPLVNAIDRIPLNEQASEASYEVIVTTDANNAADIRNILSELLATAKYPVRETKGRVSLRRQR